MWSKNAGQEDRGQILKALECPAMDLGFCPVGIRYLLNNDEQEHKMT